MRHKTKATLTNFYGVYNLKRNKNSCSSNHKRILKAFFKVTIAAFVIYQTTVSTVFASNDPCLPFTMPNSNTVLDWSKKVFAHYFYPFPISLDNLPWTSDYYTINYLNPHGENNKFVTEGGFLRARPLPKTPSSATNWQLLNMEKEINLAISRGVNGFAFDVMATSNAASGGPLQMMLQAAQAVDSRFKILLMPDMEALGGDTNAVMTIVKSVYANPSLYHLNGLLVLSPFCSECVSASAWSAMLNALKEQGYNIAFLPTFMSLPQTYVSEYASISVGLGNWASPGAPDQLSWTQLNSARVRAVPGKLFLDGMTPQDYRPKDFMYDEAYNSLAYRNAWTGAIQTKADIVHIATWSDFSESTHIEPATSSTNDSGTGFYNLTGYYSTWFETGVQPAIDHDILYYFYRKEATNSAAPAQSQPTVTSYPQTPQNSIEVLAFLTSPGTVTIVIGGATYTKAATAGFQSFTVPLAAGTPVIKLIRNGATVIQVANNPPIYGLGGLPGGVRDLTYWSGSASSAGQCVIPMNTSTTSAKPAASANGSIIKGPGQQLVDSAGNVWISPMEPPTPARWFMRTANRQALPRRSPSWSIATG